MLGMRFASVAVWRPHGAGCEAVEACFAFFNSLVWVSLTMFVWVAVPAARSRFSRSTVGKGNYLFVAAPAPRPSTLSLFEPPPSCHSSK